MRSISWTFSGFFCGGVLVGGFPGMRAPEKDIRDGLLVPHSTSAPSEIARWLGQEVEDSVVRCGWELFSFVFMPNHFYLFLRTPRPNLGKGMQRLLSSWRDALLVRDYDARGRTVSSITTRRDQRRHVSTQR